MCPQPRTEDTETCLTAHSELAGGVQDSKAGLAIFAVSATRGE
jgi:hypothetical protein